MPTQRPKVARAPSDSRVWACGRKGDGVGDVDGRALPREDNHNSRSVDEMLCGPKQTGNEPERPKMGGNGCRRFPKLVLNRTGLDRAVDRVLDVGFPAPHEVERDIHRLEMRGVVPQRLRGRRCDLLPTGAAEPTPFTRAIAPPSRRSTPSLVPASTYPTSDAIAPVTRPSASHEPAAWRSAQVHSSMHDRLAPVLHGTLRQYRLVHTWTIALRCVFDSSFGTITTHTT